MKYYNILISIDDAYLIHAKDLIQTLVENNTDSKFNIYLIHDDSLSKKSIEKLDKYIIDLECGTLKPYYFNSKNNNFKMHIDYITQNTYYRLFAPYIIEDNIDRLLYLDCDILCNGDISEFYNQDFDSNIIVACPNITPARLKEKFKKRISYLDLKENETYVNAGVLLIDIPAYKSFINIDSMYEFIKEHKDEYQFQDQDIINSLFRNKIKLGNNLYNYQINVIDYGLDFKNCKLIHYSEANKPWNNVNPIFKRYLHYYMYLYTHNRKDELFDLLKSQYNKDKCNYFKEYIEKMNNKFNEIDIIIPTFNSKDYLSKALDSIMNQTYKDIRIYIIDDASKENYSDVLDKYNQLNIFYTKLYINVGPGKARQFGIDNSFGNYIIFLDSDDVFYDDKSVEILYEAIKDSDVVTSKILEEGDNRIFVNDNIGLHGKIYRRSFLEKNTIKFPNTRLNEDSYFNLSCVLYGARYNNISELTYLWCNNPNSITRGNKEDHFDKDIVSYSNVLLNATNDYLNNYVTIDVDSFLECLVESIIIVAGKSRLCSDSVREQVVDILYQLLKIYKQYDSIDNIEKHISNKDYKKSFDKNKALIIENSIMKKNILNFYNEDKEDKLTRFFKIEEYNNTSIMEAEKRKMILKESFNKIFDNCTIEIPFYTTWGGKNITMKKGSYINNNCTMIDDGNIEIGRNTLIGPNVTICTVNHPIDAEDRLNGIIYVSDVVIGNNVWIGAGTIILPGVTIGNNSVIGAGSVVTKDIPSNVVACGNPCTIIKQIDNKK